MKCDELKICWFNVNSGELAQLYKKADVDEAIAELKQAIHDAEMAKDDAEAANTEYREDIKQLNAKNEKLKDRLQNVSELLEETREWLIESQKLHKRCADGAIKKIRHSNYKRCLAMALWSESKVYHIRRTPLCDMSEHEYYQYENDFWQRWHERWLELAENFKEAK